MRNGLIIIREEEEEAAKESLGKNRNPRTKSFSMSCQRQISLTGEQLKMNFNWPSTSQGG